MDKDFKTIVIMWLLALTLVWIGLIGQGGCVSELQPTNESEEVTKVVIPHYRVKSDIREPIIGPDGQPTYTHWLVCELDNGAWFRILIDEDPLTPEIIHRAVTKYFERYE